MGAIGNRARELSAARTQMVQPIHPDLRPYAIGPQALEPSQRQMIARY